MTFFYKILASDKDFITWLPVAPSIDEVFTFVFPPRRLPCLSCFPPFTSVIVLVLRLLTIDWAVLTETPPAGVKGQTLTNHSHYNKLQVMHMQKQTPNTHLILVKLILFILSVCTNTT